MQQQRRRPKWRRDAIPSGRLPIDFGMPYTHRCSDKRHELISIDKARPLFL